MGERKSPDAGQTTLASATAAIIAARWSAPVAPTPLPRRTPGAYGGDVDTSVGLPVANGGAHTGNGYAVNGGAPGPDGNGHHGDPVFDAGPGPWGTAVPEAALDGLPPVSPGRPTTAPVSPSVPPVSGPPVSPAPYVHGQGPGIGAAAASYFAGTSAGGFGAAAAPSIFSPVAPDPVPEVFPTPPGREPARETAHEEVRTQVPPGFERRNFGPFPDEATSPVGGWGLGDRAGRAEEPRTPEALLGVLPPAPPSPPVAATIAPPEPPPWTDSGFVGFGDLGAGWEQRSEPAGEERTASGRFGVGRDTEAPERTDTPVAVGTLAPGPRTPLPRRVPRIPDFDLPGIGVVEPAADAARQQQELNRIADFLSRGDTEPVTEDRPDGVDLDAILNAIRRVPEVRDVQLLGWNDQAGHTLRIEYADGVDESEVTRSVARLLRAQLGLAGQPGIEEPTVDSPYRRGSGTGRQLSRPPVGAGRALPRPSGVATPRLVVENVTVTRLGAEATVEVRLRQPGDGGVSVGESSGPGVDAYLSRLAATAAGAAVDKVLVASGTSRGKVFIEHVSVVPFGVVEVAVVVLLLAYDGVTEQLSGSAIVGDDPHLAVVRATLAALNRRLESLLA